MIKEDLNTPTLRHGSLFSGMGGFDLAAQWMGWQNAFHCEINPFCQRILKHYWPDATSYTDITQTDFSQWRGQIDVLTGGFPCQPFSEAGQRKGTADDRHLWPEMLRAIREIRPRYIVGENVFGFLTWNGGMVFSQACADLEAEGYEVAAYLLPALSVGAPHQRNRIWIVAHTIDERHQRRKEAGQNRQDRTHHHTTAGGFGGKQTVADATASRLERGIRFKQPVRLNPGDKKNVSAACDAGHTGWQDFPTQLPLCAGNDGLPAGLDGITFSAFRNGTIKAAGNAIVPQVALQLFEAIKAHQNRLSETCPT